MSRLILVRHGQASFMAANYDQLSPLGAEQARALGAYWGENGLAMDRVLVGPLVRQQETWRHLADSLAEASGQSPAAEDLAGLREHEANEAFATMLPELAAMAGELGSTARAALADSSSKRARLSAFGRFIEPWAEGKLVTNGFESFTAFQRRVQAAVAAIMSAAGSGETIVAVTSGGVIAATVGLALGITPRHIMRLNAVIYNASFHEFHFRSQVKAPELSLVQFNASPHLPAALQSQI